MKKTVSLLLAALLICSTIAFASLYDPFIYSNDDLPRSFNVNLLARYNSNTGFDEGGAEIVVYDAHSKRAYVANGAKKAIDIIDLSQISEQKIALYKRISIKSLNITDFKAKDITSVDVSPDGKHVAVTVAADPKQSNGRCLILNGEGDLIESIEVGALPDMVTFTPNGKKILVANEGEPNDDFTVDPEGSISIIDITKLDKISVTPITFEMYTRQNIPVGIKIIDRVETTVAQDLEPEYITVDKSGKYAYVSLQENNAIATIELKTNSLVNLNSLGVKDHSLTKNRLDASNKDGKINITTWPVLGLYQPDGIDNFKYRGHTYVITANEGDAKDYDAYSEEARVADIVDDIDLSAKYYHGYNQVELDQLVADGLFDKDQLGRLKITTAAGKNDDGKYEALYSYGGRSISIYKSNNGQLEQIYDSGSLFEDIVAKSLPKYFNVSNDNIEFDNRSDDKGPEPEDVKVGKMFGRTYAFVGMERQSAIAVIDITNPYFPVFTKLFSTRDYNVDLDGLEGGNLTEIGDVAPEGLRFVSEEDSPTGKPILIVANEVSGTVAVYEFNK